MTIGILYICTGKYKIFWKGFYESCEKNLVTEAEKHYFVFTDSPDIEYGKDNPRIHRIYQENIGWPGNTLMRFHMFLREIGGTPQEVNTIEKMDYLFFFNANLLILEKISTIDILPSGQERLVSTLHPGYFDKPRKKLPYEKNPNSTAYIPRNEDVKYFAGGLMGGYTKDFIQAMQVIKTAIDKDSEKNIIAVWHDESHWNKFLLSRDDVKILHPGYLYPGNAEIPFPKIILNQDKKNFGGHDFLRGNKSHVILDKLPFIKKIIQKICAS